MADIGGRRQTKRSGEAFEAPRRGYAHCGMVVAACWIAKLSTPCLINALGNYPYYKLKKLLLHEYFKSVGEGFKSGVCLNLETKRMSMKWRDTKNKVDCGVYVMGLRSS
ncbi:uncharacterized protein LOC116023295 [Ipomoea triloba]|uniref:uncharacterized protein LOC116023295 n=1 Tax=Ipomoea triloba TaxID=35885 RepID=UPI00125E669F|nr:uncharacterized protein LOC116023295 [Ipomoea triloba]